MTQFEREMMIFDRFLATDVNPLVVLIRFFWR